jgi:hypothetical protein
MLSLHAVLLLLQHFSCCSPAADACHSVQQVYMAEAVYDWLQLVQPTWLLLVLQVLLLGSSIQLLVEPPLMPVVLR